MTVVAEENINALGTASEDSPGNHDGDVKRATSWRIRGIPNDVRAMAKAAAKKYDIQLSEFLAEAILKHAERLEAANDTGTDGLTSALQASVLQECIARIEALENHLAIYGAPEMHSTKITARLRVKNLVERPWLKDRKYV